MLTREENDLLCRVGRGSPMGEMLRRYWMPVLLADELRYGPRPKRVRLLGENLVAFRCADGSVGLLPEACPHRGASLSLARVDGCTVTCPYHGWTIDRDGRVCETPAEPEGSTFAERLRPRGYAARDHAGLIWAYLGPAEHEPPLMDFAWTRFPREHLWLSRIQAECNWAQCVEGVIDSSHVHYLHTDAFDFRAAALGTSELDRSGTLNRPSADGRPRIEAETTPYGFRYAAIRKPIVDPDTTAYVRVTQFIAPFYALIPPPKGLSVMQMFVPIDDEHTMFVYAKARTDGPMSDEERAMHDERSGMRPGIDMDEQFRKFRRPDNEWLLGDDFGDHPSQIGIAGVALQDIVIQESMGPIYDRTNESLGASDVAVIRFRRAMIDAARRYVAGDPPLGLTEPVDYGAIRAGERLQGRDAPWQDVAEAAAATAS